MWSDNYGREWSEYSKKYLEECSKKTLINPNIYEKIVEQLEGQSDKYDKFKTWKEIEQYQQADHEKHQEELMKKYITREILSNDIFNDLDETTQAKIKLLLDDVYIIPKDKV